MSVNGTTLNLLRGLRIHVDGQLDAMHRHLIEAWASAWDTLSVEYHELMMDVADARAKGKTIPARKIARSRRAVEALKASQERLVALCEELDLQVEKLLPDLVDGAPKWQRDLWASQMPTSLDEAKVVGMLSVVDPAQLEMIVARTADTIHARTKPIPWAIEREMKSELVKGIAFGDNPRWTAKSMVSRIGDRFDLGMARAIVISRTEMLDAHRNAAHLWELDNADVMAGWEWISALDKRTCPSCWSKHGTIHDIKEPGPHDHQQGRCTRLPKAKTWADLGFKGIDEPADLLPDAQSTFEQLSAEDQLTVMGKRRLELLQSGKVSWADLSRKRTTSGWRDSYAPASVSDLEALAAS